MSQEDQKKKETQTQKVKTGKQQSGTSKKQAIAKNQNTAQKTAATSKTAAAKKMTKTQVKRKQPLKEKIIVEKEILQEQKTVEFKKIEEQTQQMTKESIIKSIALAVGVIAILVCAIGEYFLREEMPSQKETKQPTIQKKEFNPEKFVEITLDDIKDKSAIESNYLLFFARQNCKASANIELAVEEIIKEGTIVFYINTDNIDKTSASYKEFVSQKEELAEDLEYSPLLVEMKNGKAEKTKIGVATTEEIKEFLKM